MSFGLAPGSWHHGAPGAVATVPHGGSATIRAIRTTAHAGAIATVPHRCPAVIRAVGTTGRCRGRHHRPARRIRMDQAVDTPAERERQPRCWRVVVIRKGDGIAPPQKIAPSLKAAPAASAVCVVRPLAAIEEQISCLYGSYHQLSLRLSRLHL
jgi:hypothetical protein